jgi:hypothetical protein
VAVLVAAGLPVVTAGAASADEPDRGPVIVTCEDGELVTREPTEEERERLRALPVPPERVRAVPARPGTGVGPDGATVRVAPAEPAPPPVTCDGDGPREPRVERVVPALPAPIR